jgi:hypothetical protein
MAIKETMMTTLDIAERTVTEHGESVTYKFNLIMSTKDSCRYEMKRIQNNKTQTHVFDIDFKEIHIAKSIPTFIWELAECNSHGMVLKCIDVVYEKHRSKYIYKSYTEPDDYGANDFAKFGLYKIFMAKPISKNVKQYRMFARYELITKSFEPGGIYNITEAVKLYESMAPNIRTRRCKS